ncbi:MAG: HD domain-containing protein [Candidatus Buchananbacteria bacterium]
MSNLTKLEAFLKKKIYPDLQKGRPNWDKPHTAGVVAYLKRIIKYSPDIKVDKTVLIIAAYAHDWGYAGLFINGQPTDYQTVQNAKDQHMVIGAKKLSALLNDKFFSFLTEQQKQRCIHLVKVHDKIDQLKDIDEIVLMEADILSGLDIKTVTPTFDFESNKKFIQEVEISRMPKFLNQYSRDKAKQLIPQRMAWYQKK